MAQEKRRTRIMQLLREAEGPITGSDLSALLGVTRQIIVGDVAVLRAGGERIIATPQGYLLYEAYAQSHHRCTFAVRHGGDEPSIAGELNLIVDLGGTVVDVTVEHPLYGELTGNLQIKTRADVRQFLAKLGELEAEPLLVLTGGYHLHTVEAPDGETMDKIRAGLRRGGFLAE